MSPAVSRAVRIFSATATICRDSPTVSRSITGQAGMIKVREWGYMLHPAQVPEPSGVGHPSSLRLPSPPHPQTVLVTSKCNPCCCQRTRCYSSLPSNTAYGRPLSGNPQARGSLGNTETVSHKSETSPPGGARESLLIPGRSSTWCPQHGNWKAVSLTPRALAHSTPQGPSSHPGGSAHSLRMRTAAR